MTPEQREKDNIRYWHEKRDAYPFHATAPVGVPKPHHVPERLVGPFVCVPIGEFSRWGFQTEKGRALFLRTYGMAQVLE